MSHVPPAALDATREQRERWAQEARAAYRRERLQSLGTAWEALTTAERSQWLAVVDAVLAAQAREG